jgi:hypothetical protein
MVQLKDFFINCKHDWTQTVHSWSLDCPLQCWHFFSFEQRTQCEIYYTLQKRVDLNCTWSDWSLCGCLESWHFMKIGNPRLPLRHSLVFSKEPDGKMKINALS